MAKSIKPKPKPKKKIKPTKAEKEQAQYDAGAKQKFIDNIIRGGGSVREITDPFGR
ncbi:MAG: hypothetical protein NTY74_16295 [Ignavibacteriae bacterium]|nr:hypothetical protein [Ignavibacteriota bacterium]